MEILEIITESKVDEAPAGLLKRAGTAVMAKLGSKTAKTAQVLQREMNAMKKEFVAFYKNVPGGKPTLELLVQYLQQKGYPVKNPNQLTAMMKAAQKTAGKLKRNDPNAGAITPGGAQKADPNAPQQGELFQSIQFESLTEATVLKGAQIDAILKYIVQRGFQKGATKSGTFKKSAFGYNRGRGGTTAAPAKKDDIQTAINTLAAAGYKVTKGK